MELEQKNHIRGYYESKFNAFLAVCKNEEYWKPNGQEALRNKVKTANRLCHELMGMAVLMQDIGVISFEEYYKELDRITREFSTVELFGCFIGEDGDIYVRK